ncbi:peptidoglycan DD-metalloendopeptidase family protein [Thaumasiovibrio subtropicus]|uniref:peptidoglycan DD-metalloendopeptidase family protein n=1 Tax=Thaumasiovibrio subtropicus TaxID=1891207 RepID=UPI000B359902|nr:peptidoglycan DD-metalloendopeptidase family protein [Thaumasiovibrio subtropicus]
MAGCAYYPQISEKPTSKDYDVLERGSYRGSFYEVEKGDTLYFIAYITDKSVDELIAYNGLEAPYIIHPGQKLKLWRPKYVAPAYGQSAEAAPVVAVAATIPSTTPSTSAVSSNPAANSATTEQTKVIPSAHKTDPKTVDPVKPSEYSQQESKQTVTKNTPPATVKPTETQTASTPSQAKPTEASDKVTSWLWPTKGRVISKFSSATNGNKGIDIAGQRGQPINATAAGTVVYAGNALRGYGNLIIVKHNDDFLSAYAHNDQLFVKENQTVKAGQKIATMGSSGAQSVKLHFEIRFKGKSVDPMKYLN